MSRQVKQMMIDAIQLELAGVSELLIVDISRVSAASVNRIRMSLTDKNLHLKCIRNAVVSRALSDVGIKCASKVLVGPSAIVFGRFDISSISKEISKYEELHKGFEIKSGIAGGQALSRDDIDVLIKSPGKDELLSQLSAQILGPGGSLAGGLMGASASIASQLQKLASR